MLLMYSGSREYVSIAWVLVSKVAPPFKQFKVYGTWQLVSPKSILCTAKENKDD